MCTTVLYLTSHVPPTVWRDGTVEWAHIIGKTHPNIFEFLLRLCDEQCHTELTIQKLVAGDAVEPPRKRMYIVNDRISRVVVQYHERNTMDYVLGIAHNITYVM